MKRLKSLFFKFRSKRTIKTYQKPLLITIMDFLIISLAVIVVASILGMIIDADYFHNNFFKALAHFLSCMLTANTITKMMDIIDQHLGIVLISVVVIAAELVLFSGAVIATLTAAVKSYIYKKGNAKGKILLQHHFVILNWSNKVPDLIYNLILKGHKGNVIIMSDKDKEYVNNEIDSLVSAYAKNKLKRKLKLIVKVGNPLLYGDLDDISISNASNIVIMSREDMKEGDDKNISNNDLLSLKVLLTLGNFNISNDCNIVIETDSERTKSTIENLAKTINNLKENTIIPISFNRKIGQIIAQTVLDTRMAEIYTELFTYVGCEFYSSKETEYDVDSFLLTHNQAIPIIKFDRLFVLAGEESDVYVMRKDKADFESVRTFRTKEPNNKLDCNIFIVGSNKKLRFVQENLKLATVGSFNKSHFKTFYYDKNSIKEVIKAINETEGNKKVLILSDDDVSTDSYDANVFISLIELHAAFGKEHEQHFSLSTELLDSKNYNAIKDFNVKNAIISNRMMSLLLSQLALNKDSKKFFEGLLTVNTEEGGDYFDIMIEKVGSIVADVKEMHFKTRAELIQSFYLSFDKKYMLLGYIHNDNIVFLPSNQDEEAPINLEAEDDFIFIRY